MIDLLSSVRFVPSYPQLNNPTSQTKFGGRVISTVEFVDPYRTVDMETLPMKASEAVQLQAFIAAAKGGMETIVYRPKHICVPRAYWGQPSGPNTNPGDVAAQGDFVTAAYKVRGEDVPQSTALSFTRSTVGTYFDSAGVLKTAAANVPRIEYDPSEVNLTWPSEDLMSSQWAKTRIGATLAHVWNGMQFTRLTPNTTAQVSHQITNNRTFAAVPFRRECTHSMVVKSDGPTTTRLALRCWDTQGFLGFVYYNLEAGTSFPTSLISTTIEALGQGYWRITATHAVREGTTTSGNQIYAANPTGNNTTNYDFNGLDGYFVSACQFEISVFPTSTFTSYKKTTTGPAAKPLGLLFEPFRTNLCLQSGNMMASPWLAVLGLVRQTSTVIAPDGVSTAVAIGPGAAANQPYLSQNRLGTLPGAGNKFSQRISGRLGGWRYFQLWWPGGATGVSSRYVNIDLQEGIAVSSATGFVTVETKRLPDGWFRFDVTVTVEGDGSVGGVSGLPSINVAPINSMSDIRRPTVTGDGVAVSYFWGGQHELADNIGSYIPTTTVAVTRQADVATLYATGTNNWSVRNEAGVTQVLSNISGGAQLAAGTLTSKYVRDYKAITVTPPPSPIEATATRGTVTNGYTVQLLNVTPGLDLRDGDLISFQSGDYRQMVQIAYGGGAKAVSTQMTVKVDQPISSYIAAGATVRFKQPEMNTRLVKDSFQMTKGPRPTSTFQLIEVPK